MSKRCVVLLFGGRSAEHDVSIRSARTVFAALDAGRFDVRLVYIDKTGQWRAINSPLFLAHPTPAQWFDASELRTQSARTTTFGVNLSLLHAEDVVFPVLHGPNGEDGTVQGLLELLNVAYVGSGTLGSSIGMDKDVAKRLLAHAGLPIVPYELMTAFDFQHQRPACLLRARKFGFPCFVKPANAGSSVGVTKVSNETELETAIAEALNYDHKALVESAVDAREIECAVLGNAAPRISVPGEVVTHHADGFYSFRAKYVDTTPTSLSIPAAVPTELSQAIQEMSLTTFRVLELSGLARIDFFLDRSSGKLYVNEVNTLPGFTSVSMYPQMWKASGLELEELTAELVQLALEKHAWRQKTLSAHSCVDDRL